jgi:hypothetical protein
MSERPTKAVDSPHAECLVLTQRSPSMRFAGDAADVLDGARNRSVLPKRPMSPQFVIKAAYLVRDPA